MNVTVVRKNARGIPLLGSKLGTGSVLFGRLQIARGHCSHFQRSVTVAHLIPSRGRPESPEHRIYDVVIAELIGNSLELIGTEIIGGIEYRQHWVVEIKGAAVQDGRKAGRPRFNTGYLLTHFNPTSLEDFMPPSAYAKPQLSLVWRKAPKK